MKTKFLLILWCLCSFTVLAQNRYYVSQATGNDSEDGLLWSKALKTLQAALDKATDGDEIWVTAGIYLPVKKSHDIGNDGLPTSERYKTFQIPNGVKLYGGFPVQPTITTDMNQRDWERHRTILSGDLNGDDKEDFTNMEENVYHVITLIDAGESTVIDGFTITGGNADYPVWLRQVSGSGIHAISGSSGANSSPTLRNLLIEGNVSSGGGAGFSSYSTNGDACPVITNTIIRRNKSGEYGGGIAINGRKKSAPILENVIISGNQAYIGGGMYCISEALETSPVLTNVLVSGNSSVSDAGGIYFNSYAGNVEPVLTNVTIAGNKAGNVVGGLLCYAYTGISSPEIRNTVIWENKAEVMENYDFYNEGSSGSLPDLQYNLISDMMDWTLYLLYKPPFVRAIDASFAPTIDGDYRPGNGSSLINKGNNTFVTAKVDLAGKPRIYDKIVDIGAYEYQDISTTGISETIADKKVWTDRGILFIRSDRTATVRIYSINGILVQQIKIGEGTKAISLPSGFYLVSLDNETATKVYVSK
jgi:hypothetical protein